MPRGSVLVGQARTNPLRLGCNSGIWGSQTGSSGGGLGLSGMVDAIGPCPATFVLARAIPPVFARAIPPFVLRYRSTNGVQVR
jgi:hypothetical protein